MEADLKLMFPILIAIMFVMAQVLHYAILTTASYAGFVPSDGRPGGWLDNSDIQTQNKRADLYGRQSTTPAE
jgi:hypothetical protein